MRIINLMENTQSAPCFCAEHGLSFYLETEKHKILVDSGASSAFLENARMLSVDLSQVDLMVLSHGHYDHAGGILGFAEINHKAPIYMQRTAAGEYINAEPGNEHYIGIDRKIPDLAQVKLIDGNLKLDDGIFLFTGVTGRRMFSKSNFRLKILSRGELVQDDFRHEQYLAVEQDGKIYLFSGCAHNGILNILDKFRELFHRDPDVVLSGFHYMKKTEYTGEEIQIITDTARELAGMHTVFYTGHCTGFPAYELMKPIMGENLHMVHSGECLDI